MAENGYNPSYDSGTTVDVISPVKARQMTVPKQTATAGKVFGIRPNQPVYLPVTASAETYKFVGKCVINKVTKLKDITYEDGDRQKQFFINDTFNRLNNEQDWAGLDFFQAEVKGLEAVVGNEAEAEVTESVLLPYGVKDDKALENMVSNDSNEIAVELFEDGSVCLDLKARNSDFDYVIDYVRNTGFNIERVKFENGDRKKAEEFLSYARDVFLNDVDYVNAGIAMSYLQDFEGALVHLEAVKNRVRNDARVYKWSGVAKYNFGDTGEAMKDFAKAKEIDPSPRMASYIDKYIERKAREETEAEENKSEIRHLWDNIKEVFSPFKDLREAQEKNQKVGQLKARIAHKRKIFEEADYNRSGRTDYERHVAENRNIISYGANKA
ncbi:MAG: tetratricopeptide repeat protein [Candidatus Nanoarchaeia archaeon]|nr:tetratricopeptide repeat protein [Candidatus Nanoarchaeia archaeon]